MKVKILLLKILSVLVIALPLAPVQLFADYNSLKEAINDVTISTKIYSLKNNEIVAENLENLGGIQLTIFGNGYEVNGSSYTGIIVSSEQTLNIEKGTGENFVWKKFYNESNGGTICNSSGTVTIGDNINFNSNSARYGGVIYNIFLGTVTIGNDVIFSSNSAVYQGGAIYNDVGSTITIGNNVIFSSNSASYQGGAICNSLGSTITIGNNVIFGSNTTNQYGGAICNTGYSILTVGNDVIFSSNSAFLEGGAICNNLGSTITIGDNVIFSSNSAHTGGAIYNKESSLTIQDGAKFNYNVATSSGGAIYNSSGTVIIGDNANFSSNEASYGGAIYNSSGTVIIGQNVIFSSHTTACGGAIYNENNGIITIQQESKFLNNTAGNGGAINNEGTLTIENNVIFSSNNGQVGGAIYNENGGTVIIKDEVNFIDNKAAYNGGAIDNVEGTVTIGNGVIFSSNTAKYEGGAIFNYKATLTIQDGVTSNYNVATSSGGAIFNHMSELNLIANTNNIEFTENTANGVSNAIHDVGGTINLWVSSSADIIFNDRITSESNSSVLNINKSTTTLNAVGKVILNEDMSGYTGQTNLYAGTIELGQKGTLFGGNFTMDNATINLANNVIQNYNFHNLTINNTLNLKVDADLQVESMDTITADSYTNGKKIEVKAVNILKDTNKEKISLEFVKNDNMKQDVTNTATTAYSDKYKYAISYDNATGNMNFLQNGANPVSQESAVSGIGGYVSQLVVANQSFASIDNKVNQIRANNSVKSSAKQNNKNTNKKKASNQYTELYASTANQVFESNTMGKIERGLWLRPYVVSDTLDLGAVSSVDNTMYGTLAGYDMPINNDKLLSFYIGYTGGNQKYEEIKINQTAYVLGATGMLIKEKWYVGATINVGMNKSTADNDFGSDDIDKTTYSIGFKGGYDFDLGKNWILQPNMILMYIGTTSSDFTNAQGRKVKDNGISGILIQPQVKASWKLSKGWTPYGLLDVAINTAEVEPEVNETKLESMKLDPYVEYGVGVNKAFIGSAWSCYGEVTGKSGSRSGVGFNCGVKYAF